jgi:hypothetical protein
MGVEGERRLAALAVVIFEIDALPAIRAPELSHWGNPAEAQLVFFERSQFVIVPEIPNGPGDALPLLAGA